MGSQEDDALAEYHRKRDFSRTAEPAGTVAGAEGGLRYVVQRHRASHLHYDLRFEMDGVLASWAVPKGPTLDPTVKRLAMHVEDHPVEYVDFEGVIPKGEYGGGDVIVWDAGTWTPHETADPVGAVHAGELHADVAGEKIRGRLVLIRRSKDGDGRESWMLLHKHDEFAVEGWDPEEHPRSVLTGRTNEEVRADPSYHWHSDRPAASAAESTSDLEVPSADDELAGLDELGGEGTWEVFGRRLKVTNLDKVLFPAREGEEPVTKRGFLRYVATVAPVSVPYLTGRALNLHRYPNGVEGKHLRPRNGDDRAATSSARRAGGFWHKELPSHAPEWIGRWDNPLADEGETSTYLVVDEPAALVWAANFGALEWHPWTSRTEAPECPTYALFDIDPGEDTSWEQVLDLARLHRTAFEQLGVRSYPKVTGSRGIQVWVPIATGPSFDDTRAWVEAVSRTVGKLHPDWVSWKWVKRERGGKARLDYTQNAINKTLVAPYATRPRPGAPVSMPIGWHELDDPDLRPDRWTIRTAADRLREVGDLFRGALVDDQDLPAFR